MPIWGNTDNKSQKPKFLALRESEEIIQLPLFANANITFASANTIQLSYDDGAARNLANIGATVNSYVFIAGQGGTTSAIAANGYPGFFGGNNSILSISGNTITLTSNITSNISPGTIIEIDIPLTYLSTKPVEVTYTKDTILMTASRMLNVNTTIAQSGNYTQGWVHIQKKTNADGTVRYLKETLVALANPVASNTISGNTSFGQIASGV